jgi:hypothetical protein
MNNIFNFRPNSPATTTPATATATMMEGQAAVEEMDPHKLTPIAP